MLPFLSGIAFRISPIIAAYHLHEKVQVPRIGRQIPPGIAREVGSGLFPLPVLMV